MIIISNIHNRSNGFVALITILVVTSISLIIGTTVVLRSISRTSTTISEEQVAQAWASANACAERGISGLAENGTTTWAEYLGNETLTISGSITCTLATITATGTASSGREIRASAVNGDYTRRIQAVVATNTPSVVITSWQEVGDF